MHISCILYFEFSGIFLMFLGSIPTTSKKNFNKDPLKCLSLCPEFDAITLTPAHIIKIYVEIKIVKYFYFIESVI